MHLDVLLAGHVAGTVRGGGLHVGERGGEDWVLALGHGLLPDDLGGETGGAEGNPGGVVLLVDGSGGLAGDLTGLAGHDGLNVGLGLLAAAVQVEVLVDVGEGGGSPGVGGVRAYSIAVELSPARAEGRGDDSLKNKNLKMFCN